MNPDLETILIATLNLQLMLLEQNVITKDQIIEDIDTFLSQLELSDQQVKSAQDFIKINLDKK